MTIPVAACWDHLEHDMDSSMGRIDLGVEFVFIEDYLTCNFIIWLEDYVFRTWILTASFVRWGVKEFWIDMADRAFLFTIV